MWHGANKMHRRNANHCLLATIGLLLVLDMAFLWYFMTWVAWSLIFNSFSEAIVNASDKAPASIWGRIYFTVYTLTTLETMVGVGMR